MIKNFVALLQSFSAAEEPAPHAVRYCDRFLELLIDLEAQLPTRRYVNTLLNDHHLVIFCRRTALLARKEGALFKDLLQNLELYTNFEINDQSGLPLTRLEMNQKHATGLQELQKLAFQHFLPELRQFSLSPLSANETREALVKTFSVLTEDKLRQLCSHLAIRSTGVDGAPYSSDFLLGLIAEKHEKKVSQLDAINNLPLYPTEVPFLPFLPFTFPLTHEIKLSLLLQKNLWDSAVVKTEHFPGDHCLALPKLNIQFLTMHDYLLRNFNLFKLESNYEIRSDLEDVVNRMSPEFTSDANTNFRGALLNSFLFFSFF